MFFIHYKDLYTSLKALIEFTSPTNVHLPLEGLRRVDQLNLGVPDDLVGLRSVIPVEVMQTNHESEQHLITDSRSLYSIGTFNALIPYSSTLP